MIYDITPMLDKDTAVWPGDTRLQRTIQYQMQDGNNYTLSSLLSTVHIGAHADAPNHYIVHGQSIGERNLEYYIGTCQVIRCDETLMVDRLIRVEHIKSIIKAPRILFYTGSMPDSKVWNNDFVAISPEVIDFLNDKHVKLVGIDTPSVDPFHSKTLETHNLIANYDMAILEGLDLANVSEGIYELIALPLKLANFDASPVRAILRTPMDEEE